MSFSVCCLGPPVHCAESPNLNFEYTWQHSWLCPALVRKWWLAFVCLTVGSRLVNISVWHSVCLYPGSCSQWLLHLAVALQYLPWPVCQLSHSCNPIVRLNPLLLFCFDNETGQEITSISSSIFPQKLLQQIFLVRIKKNWVTLWCGAWLWVFGGLPVTPLIVDSWSVMLPLPILRQWQLLSDVWSCWMFLGFSLAIVMAKRCMNLLGV